jgi:hypothetical protein
LFNKDNSPKHNPKHTSKQCALVILADGFEETETIGLLSLLRQAGLHVKSVGLTSGLVSSAHGIWLKPDLTLTDVERLNGGMFISLVILPAGSESLDRLETDPRVHKLLRRVVARHGQIVTSREGLRIPRAAAVWIDDLEAADTERRMPVLLREPGQSLETFVHDLIRRLK